MVFTFLDKLVALCASAQWAGKPPIQSLSLSFAEYSFRARQEFSGIGYFCSKMPIHSLKPNLSIETNILAARLVGSRMKCLLKWETERANLRLSERLSQILFNATVITYLKAEIPSEERSKSEEGISHIKTEWTNNRTVKPVSQVNLMRLFHS